MENQFIDRADKKCVEKWKNLWFLQYFLLSLLMQREIILAELVEKAKELGGMQQTIKERETQYNLKKYKITEISTENALPIYQHIVQKFYKNHNPGDSGTWVENELRLFIWGVICYMEVHGKPISTMNEYDWTYFSRIFYIKEYNLFEYQARTLLDQEVKMAKWSNQEDYMLYNLITRERNAKWNEIAKSLFTSSNKTYLRSSKQCRERWLNHLDPSKTKSGWSLQEFLFLFEHVLQKGKRWALLVKKLNDRRSEHSIKNKFNSIIKKQGRLTPNLSQNEICQQLINNINRIMETHKIEHYDEFVFGNSIKFRIQDNNSRKQRFSHFRKNNATSSESAETLRKKFDIFRKKIETFTVPKIDTGKQNKKGEIVELMGMQSTKKKNEKREQISQMQNSKQDSIFCDDSYENPPMLGMSNKNEFLFGEEIKNLINENELEE